MAKKKPTKKIVVTRVTHPTQAIVLREVQLSQHQMQVINERTPAMFVKEKPGRGGKKVKYVEGGYVISKLNQTFSPAGWDFEVLEQGTTERKNEASAEGEVWIRGKLTIVDHKNGFRVSKTQYGQHPIHSKVPIGDAFKSAATDALKKCASMFGVAHDIYWGITEQESEAPKDTKTKSTGPITEAEMVGIREFIKNLQTIDALIAADQRVQASPRYNKAQKEEIHKLTTIRGNEIDHA